MPLSTLSRLVALACLVSTGTSEKWPYNRHVSPVPSLMDDRSLLKRLTPEVEQSPPNEFTHWLHRVSQGNDTALGDLFVDGTVPAHASFNDILKTLKIPDPASLNTSKLPAHIPRPWPHLQAKTLFKQLPFPLDPRCTVDKARWWYRTYDGSCNWLKVDEIHQGQYGTAKSRDYNQYSYADGISAPRRGPNPRAVSNAFFKRKKSLYYEHTPLLLGLVEFIMHDITWSADSSSEVIEVPMPEDEEHFGPDTTFQVYRTERAPGTGTSRENPRENINRATTWLDLSSLYGSTPEVGHALRAFEGGRLLAQEIRARGTQKKASYLPLNTMGVPTRTRPGIDVESLFAGGDPRTNEDWIMLAVHTLFLREHNRLCDVLAEKKPEYDDEELFQSVRLLMSAKFGLIGNAYQMAYFKDMPWPRDDGFPLYREMTGKNWLEINPANTYPWLATKGGKPTVVSVEMAVVYRFHEFIIEQFPIKDGLNETMWDQNLFDTGFNATGFIDAGLENILRGIVSTNIPNFKSGVDESFRSAGKYRGKAFDIVTWSIVHEREQGLPTFNNYFREYNKQDPKVKFTIRKTFDEFTNDPEMLSKLRQLYKTPDDVDLVVGCQLDDTLFPHTTIPTSALVISLFSLISMGNSDRFSIGFAAMRCLLVDAPWDCSPSNALEELIWKPVERPGFPNFRFYDPFWMAELDFPAHGRNLLWRIVTENTEIECLQRDPLFPFHADTNPLLCALPPTRTDWKLLASTAVEVVLALVRERKVQIVVTVLALVIGYYINRRIKERVLGYPNDMTGWPMLGSSLDFGRDSKKLFLRGLKRFGAIFGIRLGSFDYYVLSRPEDLQMMIDDGPYELHFSLGKLQKALNVPVVLRRENFDSNLHANLIRTHLSDPHTVQNLGRTAEQASGQHLRTNPMVPARSASQRYEALNGHLNCYITSIVTRCILGGDVREHPELVDMFAQFDSDVRRTTNICNFLPSFLAFIPAWSMCRTYSKFRKVLVPIIQQRRSDPQGGQDGLSYFLPFILDVVDDDDRASDLVTIITWLGLRHLQPVFTSSVLDIVSSDNLAPRILSSLKEASVANLQTFGRNPARNSPWATLRSSILESARLSGPVLASSRIITATRPLALRSDPGVRLPPGQVATLSPFHVHRQTSVYGADAASFRPGRFVAADPDIGSARFVSWGLRGPHMCPGRWFAQEALCVAVKTLLEEYEFQSEEVLAEEERYVYRGESVARRESPVVVRRRT